MEVNRKKIEQVLEYIRQLEGEVNEADKERIINMIKPAIGFKTIPTDDNKISIGKSKIGGLPDLPRGFSWPQKDDEPLLFIAQLNLSEINILAEEKSLPNEGMFSIFIGLNQEGNEFDNSNYRFIYLPSIENLERKEISGNLDTEWIFKSVILKYFQHYTIPDDEHYLFAEFDEKYEDFYFYFYEPVIDYLLEHHTNLHQILGYDLAIQSSVVYDFASKRFDIKTTEEYRKYWPQIIEQSKSYDLLFQLDCNDQNLDLSKFGSSGVFYFGIKKNDLQKHNFNEIEMAFQMT